MEVKREVWRSIKGRGEENVTVFMWEVNFKSSEKVIYNPN